MRTFSSIETSRTRPVRRRIVAVCATLGALGLVVSQEARAGDETQVKGTYAVTLAEKCVQQATPGNPPGFDPKTLAITTDAGAITYGGASDGLMVFDGRGRVSFGQPRQPAFATNVMNAPSFLVKGAIPFGIGFGPAIPFTCVGDYKVRRGQNAIEQIAVDLTCTATLLPSNPANTDPKNIVTGFLSTFNMTGFLPNSTQGFLSQSPSRLLLTDIGDAVQPVTIFVNGGSGNSLNGNSGYDVPTYRVCTRSTVLDLISTQVGR
jgi:hypothetical protein